MMHPGLGYFDVHFLFLWSSGGNIFLRKKKLLFVSGFSLAEKTNLKKFGEQYYLRNNSIYIDMLYVAAAAKLLQLCPTLCDPIDGSPSGSPIPGILQARTLEWVAISFSNAWKWKVKGDVEAKLQYFGHLMWKLTPLKRHWCWERLRAGGEGDDRD